MGRAGIKRRKKRGRTAADHEPDRGVVADMHDQAAWSSYTQDIPRLGDPYREGLRLARIRRSAGNLFGHRGRVRGDWWIAMFVTAGLALAAFALVALLVQVARWLG